MKKIYFLFLCATLLFSAGCKKQPPPEPQLPPITHEGKNIFACKVNGEIFIASGKPIGFSEEGTEFLFYSDTIFWIHGEVINPKIDIQLTFKYSYSKTL